MPVARKQIIVEEEMHTYHCSSRCVRRAFLCGSDDLSGKNFDHRRQWIKDRLVYLSGIFTLDIIGYSIQSNHLHVILRTRPDLMQAMTNEEVAQRWLHLYPPPGSLEGPEPNIPDAMIKILAQNSARIQIIRRRLNNLSWFMARLDEKIARLANLEDKCTGHFWEGRFKCRLLTDDASVLTCMAYVDLNPIRAGETLTPEESRYTSGYERIRNYREQTQRPESISSIDVGASVSIQKSESPMEREQERRPIDWLSPLNDTPQRKGVFRTVTLEEYLSLIDWLGREIQPGKRGAIPLTLEPILQRLHIRSECWLDTLDGYDNLFRRILGRADRVMAQARDAGLKWFHGIRPCREAFGT